MDSLKLFGDGQHLRRRERAHLFALHFSNVSLQLSSNFVCEQIDHGIKVGVFFGGGRGQMTRLENHFATLPILIDRENQMRLGGTLQYASYMAELALRILPEGVGRLDMTKGDLHRNGRRGDALLPFRLAYDCSALFALAIFHVHAFGLDLWSEN